MRIMFVYWPLEAAGSAIDLVNYSQVARSLGHEVVLYGPQRAEFGVDASLDVGSADAVVFVLEWNLYLHHGGRLNLVRLLAQAPRRRRIVIDCDAMYNDAISVAGDCNFLNTPASDWFTSLFDGLSSRIFQPTLHPLRREVQPFLFHGYNPQAETPLDFGRQEYSMIYVGSSWYRWRPLCRVLRLIEPVRTRLGRIGLVGRGWDQVYYGDFARLPRDAYFIDNAYLKALHVEILPPVPFHDVVAWMSKATINPVIYRPLFAHLQFVTCRTFETLAANTIPLFDLPDAFVREIYGNAALALTFGDRPTEKILDVLDRPRHYVDAVHAVRRHLAAHHSYTVRFQQLLAILQG